MPIISCDCIAVCVPKDSDLDGVPDYLDFDSDNDSITDNVEAQGSSFIAYTNVDVNNDGLKDIFFCGNQVSSKLYLNKGNNHFEDITKKAGVATNVWATGVSVVDINSDGYEDMYVCTYSKDLGTRTANLLFINNRNRTFT